MKIIEGTAGSLLQTVSSEKKFPDNRKLLVFMDFDKRQTFKKDQMRKVSAKSFREELQALSPQTPIYYRVMDDE